MLTGASGITVGPISSMYLGRERRQELGRKPNRRIASLHIVRGKGEILYLEAQLHLFSRMVYV
jgi:hypothetical protein